MRVFHDRLITVEDQAIVTDDLLGELIKEAFGADQVSHHQTRIV
jgi:hypothetical protein